MQQIERVTPELDMPCDDYRIDRSVFEWFTQRKAVLADSPEGPASNEYGDKMREHAVARDPLDLYSSMPRWPYLDIASASIPWARLLLGVHGLTPLSIDIVGTLAGDASAMRYLRCDARDVRESRKYSPESLMQRVQRPVLHSSLVPQLLVLHNPSELGRGIYLHFVLALYKPVPTVAENT